MKKKFLVISALAGGFILAGLATTGVALAQENTENGNTTVITRFATKFAENLGISTDTFCDARKETQIELIEEDLTDGKIDQEKADELIERVEESECGGRLRGPRGGPWGDPAKLAEFLGITEEELKTARDEGKTLAEIAEENGISEEELKAFMAENRPEGRPEGAPRNGFGEVNGAEDLHK